MQQKVVYNEGWSNEKSNKHHYIAHNCQKVVSYGGGLSQGDLVQAITPHSVYILYFWETE